ncbi:MAG: 50S ribosomal protein L29 [Patescibacteria group bacterium]
MKKGKENSKISENDLSKKLVTLREEVRVIRFKAEGSKSKNVKETATLKKEIARVLTEMNKNNNK